MLLIKRISERAQIRVAPSENLHRVIVPAGNGGASLTTVISQSFVSITQIQGLRQVKPAGWLHLYTANNKVLLKVHNECRNSAVHTSWRRKEWPRYCLQGTSSGISCAQQISALSVGLDLTVRKPGFCSDCTNICCAGNQKEVLESGVFGWLSRNVNM